MPAHCKLWSIGTTDWDTFHLNFNLVLPQEFRQVNIAISDLFVVLASSCHIPTWTVPLLWEPWFCEVIQCKGLPVSNNNTLESHNHFCRSHSHQFLTCMLCNHKQLFTWKLWLTLSVLCLCVELGSRGVCRRCIQVCWTIQHVQLNLIRKCSLSQSLWYILHAV